MQIPNCFSYFLVFIVVGENVIMVDDVDTPLNPPVVPVEKEELEKTSVNMNVSQWSHKEKLSRRVMHIQVDRSAWDR
jgi:hypothetical protein